MARRIMPLAAVLGFLTGPPAKAIPPPWAIEEWKSQADLILIARTTKIETVENVRGANRRIGLQPVEVLKGKIAGEPGNKEGGKPPKKAGASELYLLFLQAPEPKGPIRPHVVGGVGHPKPGEREYALVFLKKDPKAGHFRPACGSFGYIALKRKTQEDKAGTKKKVAARRKWCGRIKDEKARKAMEGYYDKVSVFLEGIRTLRGKVVRKPWSKTHESWNAGGSEYYVLDVGGAALPPGRRSAKEGAILRASRLVPLERFEQYRGKRVVVTGVFVEGRPHKPPPGSVEQRPAGPALRGSGFKVYEIAPAKGT